LYRQSYQLLMQPLSPIKLPLTSLSLPVLSSLKKEPERYRSYFNKLLDISISLALPVAVYCFLESDFLIPFVLGSQWLDAIPIFRILAIGGIFVSASFLPGLALLSHGYSKKYMQLLMATSAIQTLSFVAGSPFGVNGIAIAYTASSFLVLIPMVVMGFRNTYVRVRMFFLTILWPLLSAFMAGALSYALLRYLPFEGTFYHLSIAGIFFIIYTSLTLVRKETRSTLISIWKSIATRKKGSPVEHKSDQADG
jgi:PST family polysaccharide transporter